MSDDYEFETVESLQQRHALLIEFNRHLLEMRGKDYELLAASNEMTMDAVQACIDLRAKHEKTKVWAISMTFGFVVYSLLNLVPVVWHYFHQ